MSFINDIRNIQAQTIIKHEEEMRRDRDIVLKVVHIIKEQIKAEIERRIENYWSDGDVDSVVVSGELEELIDFIDSLPDETDEPKNITEEAELNSLAFLENQKLKNMGLMLCQLLMKN